MSDVLNMLTSIESLFAELLWIAPELLPLTITPGSTATQKGDVYSFAIILEEIVVRGGPYEITRTFMTAQEVWSISFFFFNSNFSAISLSFWCLCYEDREQSISIGESSFKTGSHAEGLSFRYTFIDGEVLARSSWRTTQLPYHSWHNTRNHEVLLFQIRRTIVYFQLTAMATHSCHIVLWSFKYMYIIILSCYPLSPWLNRSYTA